VCTNFDVCMYACMLVLQVNRVQAEFLADSVVCMYVYNVSFMCVHNLMYVCMHVCMLVLHANRVHAEFLAGAVVYMYVCMYVCM
jgi:hypothetical protein